MAGSQASKWQPSSSSKFKLPDNCFRHPHRKSELYFPRLFGKKPWKILLESQDDIKQEKHCNSSRKAFPKPYTRSSWKRTLRLTFPIHAGSTAAIRITRIARVTNLGYSRQDCCSSRACIYLCSMLACLGHDFGVTQCKGSRIVPPGTAHCSMTQYRSHSTRPQANRKRNFR